MTLPSRGSAAATAGFRPEIQALRALAVALVVGYHLFPGRVSGGYIGVDVFFVISGYLITAHLLREQVSTGRIALRAFYARRIRRLLPAAMLVLAVSVVAVTIALPESVRQSNFREIAASALYVENWSLAYRAVDYLGSAAMPSIVQHYWSLSAEEQFYIVWPLLLLAGYLAARRVSQPRRHRVVIAVLAVFALLSLTYGVWITAHDPAWAYFVTPARAWEFAAGALVAALALPERVEALPRYARVVGMWLGLAAIATCAMLFTAHTPFPGIAALAPVIGTALVIAAGDPRSRVSPMLLGRTAPVQYVGDISYAVYLWHWPLVVVIPAVTGHPIGLRSAALIVALTLVLAALTRRFVEKPLLAGRLRRARPGPVFVAAAGAMVVVVAASLGSSVVIDLRLAAKADEQAAASEAPCYGARALLDGECGDPYAVPDDLDTTFAATDFADTSLGDCGRGNTVGPIGDSVECSFGDESADHLVVIIGDSHAGHWIPALQQVAADRDWHLVSLVRSSCPFTTVVPLDQGVIEEGCANWRDEVVARIGELRPDLVIVASLAPDGYTEANFDLGPIAKVRAGYVEMLTALDRSAPVAVIRDTPYFAEIVPDCLGVHQNASACGGPQAEVLDAHEDPLREAANEIGAPVLDFTPQLCGDSTCHVVIGGVVVYRDRHHFSAGFSRSLSPFVIRALTASGLHVP